MRRVLIAGFLYFLVVFAGGFALGAIRTLFLEPRIGEVAAVTAELPFMLWISWAACGFAVRRLGVDGGVSARLAMGAAAFALLTAAEIALSSIAFGRAFSEYVDALAAPAGILGFAGQTLFGLIPTLQLFAAKR